VGLSRPPRRSPDTLPPRSPRDPAVHSQRSLLRACRALIVLDPPLPRSRNPVYELRNVGSYSPVLTHVCSRVETVFSPLAGRINVKHTWAWDLQQEHNRLGRGIFAHTQCTFLHQKEGDDSLRLAAFISA
jgi:hypothetical protein